MSTEKASCPAASASSAEIAVPRIAAVFDAEPPKRFFLYLDQGEELYTRPNRARIPIAEATAQIDDTVSDEEAI
jgi:hypothetical protein